MPIEFRCHECSKLLRVPDTAAGKKAKCPQCAAIMVVPASSLEAGPPAGATGAAPSGGQPQDDPFTGLPGFSPAAGPAESNPFADATAGPGKAQESFNPYQSPAGFVMDQAPGKGLARARIDFGELISRTWRVFSAQLGQCVLFGLMLIGLQIAGQVVAQPLGFAQQALSDEPVAVVVIVILQQAWGQFVQAFMTCITVPFALNVIRGSSSPFDRIFSMGSYFFQVLGQQLLVMVMIVGIIAIGLLPMVFALFTREPAIIISVGIAGFAVAMVVAIILGMMFFLAPYFVIDRRMGVIESLRMSKNYMEGNKVTVFLVMLVVGLLGTLFVVLTCCIGALFYIPYFAVLGGVIYLSATGQISSGGMV